MITKKLCEYIISKLWRQLNLVGQTELPTNQRIQTELPTNQTNLTKICMNAKTQYIYDLKFHFYVMEKVCDFFTSRLFDLITILIYVIMDNFCPYFFVIPALMFADFPNVCNHN